MEWYYNKIFSHVAKELGLSIKDVKKAYNSYYHFIVDTIKEMDLNDKEDMAEEEFNKLKKSFNIPSIGKLHMSWQRYAGLKRMKKYYKENIENGRVQDKND